jgi:hypothetical protein
MKDISKRQMVVALIERLNQEASLLDSQDQADERYAAAEEVLKERGYTGDEGNWDELLGGLARSVVFCPARWVKAGRRVK